MSFGVHPIKEVIAGQVILGTSLPTVTVNQLSLAGNDSSGTNDAVVALRAAPPINPTELFSLDDHSYWRSNVATTGQMHFGITVVACVGSTMTDPVFGGRLLTIVGSNNATPRYTDKSKPAFDVCQDLLAARRGLLTPDQFSAIYRQLKSLLGDDEDQDASLLVSPTSFDGLIEFLSIHRPNIHPNVSVMRDGRFTASWSRGKRARVTLVFDREGGDWVGVDLEAQPPARAAGAFVINSLAGIAPPFRNWIKTA